MFQDVELSRECQIAFQHHCSSSSLSAKGASSSSSFSPGSSGWSGVGGVDMHVQVLTTGYWPTPAAVHTTSKKYHRHRPLSSDLTS